MTAAAPAIALQAFSSFSPDSRGSPFPDYQTLPDRNSKFRMFDTCHRPPLAVRTPRLLRADASPRKSVMPALCSDSIIGMTLAANASASSISIRRPFAKHHRLHLGTKVLSSAADVS